MQTLLNKCQKLPLEKKVDLFNFVLSFSQDLDLVSALPERLFCDYEFSDSKIEDVLPLHLTPVSDELYAVKGNLDWWSYASSDNVYNILLKDLDEKQEDYQDIRDTKIQGNLDEGYIWGALEKFFTGIVLPKENISKYLSVAMTAFYNAEKELLELGYLAVTGSTKEQSEKIKQNCNYLIKQINPNFDFDDLQNQEFLKTLIKIS